MENQLTQTFITGPRNCMNKTYADFVVLGLTLNCIHNERIITIFGANDLIVLKHRKAINQLLLNFG